VLPVAEDEIREADPGGRGEVPRVGEAGERGVRAQSEGGVSASGELQALQLVVKGGHGDEAARPVVGKRAGPLRFATFCRQRAAATAAAPRQARGGARAGADSHPQPAGRNAGHGGGGEERARGVGDAAEESGGALGQNRSAVARGGPQGADDREQKPGDRGAGASNRGTIEGEVRAELPHYLDQKVAVAQGVAGGQAESRNVQAGVGVQGGEEAGGAAARPH